jgi:hypothetical protein
MSDYYQPRLPKQRKPRYGFAIAALVLGIVAACGSPVPILNNATIIAGFIGVVFAILALFGTHYVMASIGLFLALLGVVVGIALQVHWGHEIDNITSDLNSIGGSSTSAPAAPAGASVTITLTAHGVAGDTVEYSTSVADLTGKTVTLDQTGSWTDTYSLPADQVHGFASVEVESNAPSDQALNDHMSCTIAQNGALHDQQTNALMVLCSSGTLGR